MKKLLTIILLLVTVSGLQNCKPEKPADPCDAITPASAEFEIMAGHGFGYKDSSYLPFDTIYRGFTGGGGANFKVSDNTVDSCWWKIGNDPRVFTQKEFQLFFSDSGEYDIRLITYKSSAGNCGKQQYDTVWKKMWLLPAKSNPIIGKYSGYVEDTPDSTFEIEIKFWSIRDLAIYSFPQGCTNDSIFRNSTVITSIGKRFFFYGNVVEGTFKCDMMHNLEREIQTQGRMNPTDYPHGYFDKNTGEITIVWWQRTKIENGKAIQRRRVFTGKKL